MKILIAIFVLTFVAVAVIFDLLTDKVPNLVIAIGYVAGGIYMIHEPADIIRCLISLLLPIVLLYPLFLVRGLGAGDIKLFSVLSMFFPRSWLLQIMIQSVFIGSFVSLLILFIDRFLLKRIPRKTIHYTPCILAACLITILLGR